MKARILVSQGIGHVNHNDGPHYWILDSLMSGEGLREELEDWVWYPWEEELLEKMTNGGVKKVVHTGTGMVGYVYRGRLVVPDWHLGGRTPDRWPLCEFAKAAFMK